MATVAVTGAAGSVGRQTLAALSAHTVTPITHRAHDDLDSVVLDVTDRAALVDAFDGHDVVVHMAAAPDPQADWEQVADVNIDGTYNVYAAAERAGCDRVVFGSSSHVTHMHNMADPADPKRTRPDATAVSPDTAFRPSSPYGISKVTGEVIGRFFADRHDLSVLNLRIGILLDEAQLRATQDSDPDRARQVRAMFLSHRDYRQAARCAVETDLNTSPVTVNIVSRNDDRYLSLVEAMQHLDYRPQDNASEILAAE
jgi:L-arabinose 1-dehydrogenase [NAD(P)+]